jgi:AraC-like DNA-binding protein
MLHRVVVVGIELRSLRFIGRLAGRGSVHGSHHLAGCRQRIAVERSVEAWAAWGAISTRSLSRRFVLETGFTFTAWRQRARLLRALEMLADDVPVTTIALQLGYSTPSAFIALFKRTFGATPLPIGSACRGWENWQAPAVRPAIKSSGNHICALPSARRATCPGP